MQRFRSRLSAPLWVLTYTGAYVCLLGVVSTIDFFRHSSDPSWGNAVMDFLVSAFFLLPLSILPVAGALCVLWVLRHLRWWQFRLAAVPICCLPSVLTLDDWKVTLPVQIILGLIVMQPYSTADEDPGF
ncbi:hypothetical protein EV385_4638 [Krasilnikovia cinnamomea]|uniref:Uncharacterized protein n=2 Tax=Krasilnikovia cinnamomea TaxID=349313 RepID=A0A4Q7ZQL8_9ACTN|nr:hypothetical protein EV385_4638 [Krasilnikovia cinnamomea]